MRPYSVPRFWRMIDDGEKRPTLPPPHLFDLWITILASRNIPYLLTGRGNKLRLYVPALLERQARSELEAVLAESRKPRPVYIEPPAHNNAHWALSVLLLLILWHGVRMHWGFLAHLPGLPDLPPEEWSRLGSLDVFRVKTFGEWYRCVTALTLHADSQHLFGNVLFGAPFLILLCRRVGLGLGLFLILLAGSFGNALNAWYRPAGHISLGFSTALFGTVGVLSGFMALQGWGSRTQSDTGKLSWRGLRRTPVRAALRLHRRWSRRLDITAYGPLSGHKYATRPERRRAGRAVLEVGAVALPADASHT